VKLAQDFSLPIGVIAAQRSPNIHDWDFIYFAENFIHVKPLLIKPFFEDFNPIIGKQKPNPAKCKKPMPFVVHTRDYQRRPAYIFHFPTSLLI